MATVNPTGAFLKSPPLVCYEFDIEGLIQGSNAITLSATGNPAGYGTPAFPPDGNWTPGEIECFPYNIGAVGALVTPDLTTIANSNGQITFTLYAAGATNARIRIY